MVHYLRLLALAGPLLAGPHPRPAQTPARREASSCGAGCNLITVRVKDSGAYCSSGKGLAYTVQNNTSGALDIAFFAEKVSGGWKDLGTATNVKPGAERNDIWGCDLTGRYRLYYRQAGSSDRLP
ncbi:MAG: hypothetical protein ACRYFX_02500 [Janthinobacterium lividum]